MYNLLYISSINVAHFIAKTYYPTKHLCLFCTLIAPLFCNSAGNKKKIVFFGRLFLQLAVLFNDDVFFRVYNYVTFEFSNRKETNLR